MGVQDTWMGLTITVLVLMFCLQLVQVWGNQTSAIVGRSNVTLTQQKVHYSFVGNQTKSTGDWPEWITTLFDRQNIPEEKEGGADFSGITFAKILYNVFNNGSFGFSNYMHNLLGLPYGMGGSGESYLHSYIIEFIQWFLVIGNGIIVLQVLGKFLPGG